MFINFVLFHDGCDYLARLTMHIHFIAGRLRSARRSGEEVPEVSEVIEAFFSNGGTEAKRTREPMRFPGAETFLIIPL